MNINSRIARANFIGFTSGTIASFTGLRAAPTKVKVTASGVSECNVVRCGKNIWSYGDVSGTKRVAVTVDIKAGTYTVSANITSSDTDYDVNLMLFNYKDNTTESVLITRGTRQSVTFTLTKNVKSINFYASRSNNASDGDTFSFNDIQFELGSQATSFEAYTSNSYNIPVNQTFTQIWQNIGVNNIFIDDENVDTGNVEVYYVTI